MADDLFEHACEAIHDAWATAKRANGFHAPSECPCRESSRLDGGCPDGIGTMCPRCNRTAWWNEGVYKGCAKCHRSLVPFAALPESEKDLDRAPVRAAVAPYVAELDRLRAVVEEMSDTFKNAEGVLDRCGIPRSAKGGPLDTDERVFVALETLASLRAEAGAIRTALAKAHDELLAIAAVPRKPLGTVQEVVHAALSGEATAAHAARVKALEAFALRVRDGVRPGLTSRAALENVLVALDALTVAP